jgi:hypothetical protein
MVLPGSATGPMNIRYKLLQCSFRRGSLQTSMDDWQGLVNHSVIPAVYCTSNCGRDRGAVIGPYGLQTAVTTCDPEESPCWATCKNRKTVNCEAASQSHSPGLRLTEKNGELASRENCHEGLIMLAADLSFIIVREGYVSCFTTACWSIKSRAIDGSWAFYDGRTLEAYSAGGRLEKKTVWIRFNECNSGSRPSTSRRQLNMGENTIEPLGTLADNHEFKPRHGNIRS